MRGIVLLPVLFACGATQETRFASQPATLGDVHYDAPDHWIHHEGHEGSRLFARWAPEANSDKEVVSVFRTELRADKRRADIVDMESMLVEAQKALPHVHASDPRQLKTAQGLDAIEISADFVPNGQTQSYHRVHAFVISGSALVHVLYTARTPDPELRAFHLVVDSIRREEG